jgi:hypothetical protein
VNTTSRMIARTLKQIRTTQRDSAIRLGVELSAQALSDALASVYPAFDATKFLRACGVEPRHRKEAHSGGTSKPP